MTPAAAEGRLTAAVRHDVRAAELQLESEAPLYIFV